MIRLAVFGKPVKQSLSPRIHGLFAGQCGLEVDYRAIEADPEDFPRLVAELAEKGGRGCNITAPLKRAAWQLATHCSENPTRAEAANTLIFVGAGDWHADNTDGAGLVRDLRSSAGCQLEGARVCLFGAGGAAAGVLGALLQEQPTAVIVANRTQERAEELRKRHADLGPVVTCTPQGLDTLEPFDLVINATSLGHAGGASAIMPQWLRPGGMCYDLNYGKAAEPLQQWCLQQAIPYSDGLGMLVGQAALSFRLWTGSEPDTAPVLEQIRREENLR